MDIDELKILEWCGFTNPRIDPWGFWLWDMADGGLFRGDKKDKPSHDMLYSLDWQAKYLYPQIFKTPLSIKLYSDDGYWFCQFIDDEKDDYPVVADSVVGTENMPKSVLWAVMELINEKNTD